MNAAQLRTPPDTARLSIRPLGLEDAEFILELLNDPGFLQFIGDRGVRSLDDAARYIETGPMASYARHGFGLWRVARRQDDVPVGICGLLKRDTLADVDIGFAYLARYAGHGYGYEAARATLDFGRGALGLGRIVAIVQPDNDRSTALLRKLGMQREALLPEDGNGNTLALYA
jgi:ribosomal-protein-alanine N-acetyltransferase